MAVRIPGPGDVQQVGAGRDPGIRAGGDDFGAAMGRAMQDAGRAIQGVAQVGAKLRQERQDAEDKIYLDTFDLEHSLRSNEVFLTAQEESPLGGEGFTTGVDARLTETEKTLPDQVAQERGFKPSTRAKQAAQSIAISRRANVLSSAQTWEHNKRVEALAGQYNDTIDKLEQEAFTSGNAEKSLGRLHESMQVYEGVIPADKLQEATEAAEQRIVAKTVEGLLLAGREDEAAQITEKFFGGRPASISASTTVAGGDAMSLLRDFEGYRDTPYWDVNANRIGYGSDTVTRADGSVVKVTKGMRITRADAERDLARRTKEFEATAIKQVGQREWGALPAKAQAALVSVAYNYGSLPGSVVNAIKSGDIQTVANAVESLSSNKDRRRTEAQIIRGGGSIRSNVPQDGPIMPNASAALAAYKQIDTARKSSEALFRADLEKTVSDAIAATTNTGSYTGAPVTEGDFVAAYGAQGPTRFAEFQSALDTGATINDMRTMSADDIAGLLSEARPKHSGPGFAAEQQRLETLQNAAQATMQARAADPYGYVAQSVPAVQQVWQKAQESGDPAMTSSAIDTAVAEQIRLGIPVQDLAPLPAGVVQSAVEAGKAENLSSTERMAQGVNLMSASDDPNIRAAIFEQMVEGGMPVETMSAFAAAMRGDMPAAERLFTAAVTDVGKLPGDLGVKDSEINATIQDNIMAEGSVGDAVYGLVAGRQDTRRMAEADGILMTKAVKLRLMQTGGDLQDAVDAVSRDIYGPVSVVSTDDATILVPEEADSGMIMAGLRASSGEIEAALASVVPEVPGDLTGQERADAMLTRRNLLRHAREAVATGEWRNVGQDTYALFDPATGNFFVDGTGRIMEVPLDRALSLGAENPADISLEGGAGGAMLGGDRIEAMQQQTIDEARELLRRGNNREDVEGFLSSSGIDPAVLDDEGVDVPIIGPDGSRRASQ